VATTKRMKLIIERSNRKTFGTHGAEFELSLFSFVHVVDHTSCIMMRYREVPNGTALRSDGFGTVSTVSLSNVSSHRV
jgi:hypothetical protein